MANLTLKINSSNLIANATPIVLAGKSGAVTEAGVSYITCTNYVVGVTDITFTLANLHLIYENYFSANATSNSSNIYIQAPITQFAAATTAIRNSGYYNYYPYTTLEVKSSNIIANTITVHDKVYNNVKQSSGLLNPKFKLRVFQPELTSNVIYVSGKFNTYDSFENVVGVSGTSIIVLPVDPEYKNDVLVYLDDKQISDFSWPHGGNTKQVALTLDGTYSNLRISTLLYTTPAIEPIDVVSLPLAKNNYAVYSTSYMVNNYVNAASSLYSATLTSSKFYKLELNKKIFKVISGTKLVNISKDLVGRVIDNSRSNITISYDDSYKYTYNLANNNIYYLYKKSSAIFKPATTDTNSRLKNVPNGNYILRAANINKYNRTSPQVPALIKVEPIALAKIDDLIITEEVIIDSISGAVINATISFPPITDRDVMRYNVQYLVAPSESESSITDSMYNRVFIPQNTSVAYLQTKVNNIYRGRSSNTNSLYVKVTPLNGGRNGFTKSLKQGIIGKINKPNGLKTFIVSQNNDSLLFSWSIVLTSDGYIADLDAKEIEIREYAGILDVSSPSTIDSAWSVSLEVARVTYNATSFTLPATKYGDYTYLARVRDTSDLESDKISAFVINIQKPDNVITYKAYNEANAAINYAYNGPVLVINSNQYPEASFSSIRQSNTDGFVIASLNSTQTDNANGSSSGFSVVSNSDSITTGASSISTYITPIRDIGTVIRGAIKLDIDLTILNNQITFDTLYESVFSGVTDYHPSAGLSVMSNVLVDNAFGGIGYILGFGNANAATATYNTYHGTLTSGGPYGNVYAIRGTSTTAANANSFAKIAGIISANAIVLGEVFTANGSSTGGNNYSNVTISGNSYQLINFSQFIDPDGDATFLGPVRSIEYNVFVRYSTANVYYTAAANGVSGSLGHGNTNALAFYGISNNDPETAWIPYTPGEMSFRYFQIKLEVYNKEATQTTVNIDKFKYQVDLKKKVHSNTIVITSGNSYIYDYSYLNLLEDPVVNVMKINNSNTSLIAIANNISNSSANIFIVNSTTNTIYSGGNVSVSVYVTGI